jgi:hypothetical protein
MRSPLRGGFSKFGILHDGEMSEVMPDFSVIHRKSSAAWLSTMLKRSHVNYSALVWRSSDIAVALVAIQPRTAVHWHRTARVRRFNWRQIAHMMILKGRTSEFLRPRRSSQSRSNTQRPTRLLPTLSPAGGRLIDSLDSRRSVRFRRSANDWPAERR